MFFMTFLIEIWIDRICVIGMAASHAALNSSFKIASVEFDVGKRNRQLMEAKGKSKKASDIPFNYVVKKVQALSISGMFLFPNEPNCF